MAISSKKLGSFVLTGFATQAATAVAGLLLVRWMIVSDYAIYTVGVTLVGAVRVLTRSGVQAGLASVLARVWPNRVAAADAVDAAMRVRLLISAVTMPPILALSWYLLARAGAGEGVVAALMLIIAATWLADTQGSVIDQVLFFDGKAVRVQILDGALSLLRLILIGVLGVVGAVGAVSAMLANFFGVVARIPHIKKWIAGSVPERSSNVSTEAIRSIRIVAIRQIPVDLFIVLQAQSALYYLTQSGGGIELATYGALARIAQILTPFSAVIVAFFVPAFADVRDSVVSRIFRYVAIGAIPGFGLAAWAILAPSTLLFFIGPSYSNQTYPLMVCAGTVAIMNSVEVAASLIAHRGWNRCGWLRIAFGVAWIASAPFFIAVDTAAGGYLFYCGFTIGTVLALTAELVYAQSLGEIRLGRALPESRKD